ncbi:MAG: alpha/beta hydrolase family protein [Cyclobacteriaceae bacterium]
MQIRFLLLCCFLLIPFKGEDASAQTKSGIHEKDLARENEEEDLNVFQQWIRWNNGGSLLLNHLIGQAYDLYAIRDSEIEKLKTRNDWLERQNTVRRKLSAILGPVPAKTPLQPVITGVIKHDGYRIEKLVYQSHPGFHVTAALYVPERVRGKVPAVLNLIGHEQESFRAPLDQVIATNLVKKGIVVLTIDPLGQGEHLQYFDPKVNFSSIGYSVIEHCYFGNQCFLSGNNSAKYFVWDAIRGIDYLVSRKEVDPERIGVTGFSGGGTITSFVAALDDRVKVAIPSSWSTASRRQLETKGAQDAEATLLHSVAKGITLEDLIEVRAPKPTMMTFVSRDEYLSIQGAREAYSEAKKAYEAFGSEENIAFVEDDSKHWLTPKIRKSMFDFFLKHFGMPGDPSEVEVEIFSQEQLKVTNTGQIASSLGGDMLFDLNKKETQTLLALLEASRKDIDSHLKKINEQASVISGYRKPENDVKPFLNGRYRRNGYTVAKIAIRGEGEYPVPFLLFVPDATEQKHRAIVYLHPEGKIKEALSGGEIERLVKKGYVVAAADVIGVGETSSTAARGLADGYMGVLIGRSVVGIQAGDIVRMVNYLKTRPDIDPEKIGAIARGTMCLPLIHAAAFDPSIDNVTLVGSLISYRSVAMNRFYRIGLTERPGGGVHHPYEVDFTWGIANVLTGYDLPDLIGSISPRKIVLAGLTDQMLQPATKEVIDQDMQFPLAAYSSKNAASNIRIVSSIDIADSVDWTFE